MVLETERYNGGYKHQNYSAYQGPTGSYNSYEGVTEYTHPNSGPFQGSTYPSNHGSHLQSGWSTGSDHYGNGAGHYPGGNMGGPIKPTIDGYGSSYYENSYAHGNSNSHGNPHHQGHVNSHGQGYGSPHHQGHGSPHHQGHGSPHHQGHGSPHGHGQSHGSPYGQGQGHGSPHGLGKVQGFGGAITTQINKLTHGHNSYGNGSPNCGPTPTGFNHGYQQQPSWTLKGLDMDD
ncbi:hypothetical protein SSX86_017350 [Deinandra increscens subsp. villosa]|uniref:Uncharacterized protein n=1 Tax=Deinandra increscens subsp. villosa TaxID=3103831 RepID=A0AAP0GYG4_9ASTR